jgi:hypothetical protein
MAEFQASGVGVLSQQSEEVIADYQTEINGNHNHE